MIDKLEHGLTVVGPSPRTNRWATDSTANHRSGKPAAGVTTLSRQRLTAADSDSSPSIRP